MFIRSLKPKSHWYYFIVQILVFYTICLPIHGEAKRKTILQCFSEIKHLMLTKSLVDPILKKRSIRKADVINGTVSAGELIVDVLNHYMEIKGSGGLELHSRQYALYSPESERIFAISRQYSAFNPEDNFIAFLTEKDGSWVDITAEIFPKFEIASFTEKPENISEEDRKLLSKFGLFRYPLPRVGTTILAEFDLDWYNWQNRGQFSVAKGIKILKLVEYQFIEVKWLKDQRKFEISKRIARKPQ
jgi:hypothetical protein